jgi:hypothetical protein
MEYTQGEKNGQLHEPIQSTSPLDDHRDSCAQESGPVKSSRYSVVLVMMALAIAIFVVAMV